MTRSWMLLPLMLLAAALPAAASHCNEINLYGSYGSVSYDPFAQVGCMAGFQTGDDVNTDIIPSGSTAGTIFTESATAPLPTTVDGEGTLQGSALIIDGVAHPVTWTRGSSTSGSPNKVWFTQEIPWDQGATLAPGMIAVARVCYAEDECVERTYRSAGSA